jgi:hypothetical protein
VKGKTYTKLNSSFNPESAKTPEYTLKSPSINISAPINSLNKNHLVPKNISIPQISKKMNFISTCQIKLPHIKVNMKINKIYNKGRNSVTINCFTGEDWKSKMPANDLIWILVHLS